MTDVTHVSSSGVPGHLRALTHPPGHHFFGYYGISPWDRAASLHLALETDFHDRPPTADDQARVITVPHDGSTPITVGTTSAFNLQQGAMLHWIHGSRGEELTYNVRASDPLPAGNPGERSAGFGPGRMSAGPEGWFEVRPKKGLRTAVYNPASDTYRYLDYALSAVAPQLSGGPHRAGLGAGLSFLRMGRLRPVVGYAGSSGGSKEPATQDPPDPQPRDDGLFIIDLESGEGRLALSIAELAAQAEEQKQELAGRSPSGIANAPPPNQAVWFNHTVFSPSGDRLVFLARAKTAEKWSTSLWLYDIAADAAHCLIPFGHWVSHFLWLNDRRVLVSTDVLGGAGFVEIEIPVSTCEPSSGNEAPDDTGRDGASTAESALSIRPTSIEGLPPDGHPALSPDGDYLICDTYHHHEPDGAARLLRIPISPNSDGPTVLARLPAPAWCRGDVRCDLHPRFSPDGSVVSIESVHEGSRQIHVLDRPVPPGRKS